MPRPGVSATTTVVQTTDVTLAPQLQQRLLVRLEEYARLNEEIAKRKSRQDAIKAEVDTLFVEAGEGNALMNGTDIGGYKVKMVCGLSSRLDKKRLVDLGCEPSWLEEATITKPNRPYVRISAPGEKGGDE